METVRFAKHYSKLDESSFTTIRKHKKDIVNQNVKIVSPKCDFIARCVKIEKTTPLMMDDELLNKDTDTKSIYQGFLELKKYYPGLTLDDSVYVCYFEKNELKKLKKELS